MRNIVNCRWLLKGYPEGMPTVDNWTMDEQPVPDPGPGQILVKAKWLSVDPYMRGRISPATNYTKGIGIGDWSRARFTLCQRRYDIVPSRKGT